MTRKLIGQVFWDNEMEIAELIVNTETLNDTDMLMQVCSDIDVDTDSLRNEAYQQVKRRKK